MLTDENIDSIGDTVERVNKSWDTLNGMVSTGKKAWHTQVKNHYMKIIEKDPEAAAKIMALNELLENEQEKEAKKKASA